MSRALALLLLVASGAAGAACTHPRAETRRLPAWVFEASRSNGQPSPSTTRSPPRGGIHGRSESSDFVVAALQASGLKFGTDGSVAALWDYLRGRHGAVPPLAARSGDVVFFRLAPPSAGEAAPCDAPDRAGIVSAVHGDGRITFMEARDRQTWQSYVDPLRPRLRRDATGRVHNTFLRPARIADPTGEPLLAGEMLCAVARPPAT